MSLHRHTARQLLPVPVDEAWAFFSDPANLAEITPPWLNLTPTSPVAEAMHPGMIVTYRIGVAPALRVTWVTEITHVVAKSLFVDEQRFGPYRFWHHQHHFREVAGGTEMEDVVHFALPFGAVGELAGGALVGRRVSAIFQYRRAALRRLFPPAPVALERGAGQTPRIQPLPSL